MFRRLPLVDSVEVKAGVVGLDGLEKRSESVLEATRVQRSTTKATYGLKRTILDQFGVAGSPFRLFLPRSWRECLP